MVIKSTINTYESTNFFSIVTLDIHNIPNGFLKIITLDIWSATGYDAMLRLLPFLPPAYHTGRQTLPIKMIS